MRMFAVYLMRGSSNSAMWCTNECVLQNIHGIINVKDSKLRLFNTRTIPFPILYISAKGDIGDMDKPSTATTSTSTTSLPPPTATPTPRGNSRVPEPPPGGLPGGFPFPVSEKGSGTGRPSPELPPPVPAPSPPGSGGFLGGLGVQESDTSGRGGGQEDGTQGMNLSYL